ncbi:efflux transporter outer membrane subunit [Uliginosibacterium gangwonense]|uniref:efflux transporter outer membrane subunit n=1 Tax=Uliginosibacterium gangwonense TaxID=392736 RepID=UPI000363CC75|nr:efflux transporter outer membrane subunit [Uliginosibacterium gangwonense]
MTNSSPAPTLSPLLRGLPLLAALMAVAGCSLAPHYERPPVATPAAFKEQLADPQWKTAEPAEASPRGEWWTAFGDAQLNQLEAEAAAANQDLQAGMARLLQARAQVQNSRAEYFPQIGVGAGATRQRPSPASQGLAPDAHTEISTLWRTQGTVAYEPDLFGRIRSNVDAATATREQSEALFLSLQLTIQADVAQSYFTLRELDALSAVYADTLRLREETTRLIQHRFDEGDISELELAQSRTELAQAHAESLGVARQRAVAEHSLAILLGKAPADFGLPPSPLQAIALQIPAGVPSTLLERRPDIAAAEGAMAAANARIGAARAAYFPRLSLTGNFGFESADLSDLFKWSSRTFAFGPLVGTALTLPLFDGGARRAGVDLSKGVYAEQVANYRQTVLRAFREVEDDLAQLRLLHEQMQAQNQALVSAQRSSALSKTQYREGSVSYLNVMDADRSVLQQQRSNIQLEAEHVRTTIDLIRALGGSWGPSDVVLAQQVENPHTD